MLFSCKKDENSGGLPDGTAKMTVNGTEVNFDMCILSVSNYYGYKITQITLTNKMPDPNNINQLIFTFVSIDLEVKEYEVVSTNSSFSVTYTSSNNMYAGDSGKLNLSYVSDNLVKGTFDIIVKQPLGTETLNLKGEFSAKLLQVQ